MVLEFVSGGEMFTHLRNSNRFRYATGSVHAGDPTQMHVINPSPLEAFYQSVYYLTGIVSPTVGSRPADLE